MFFPFVIPSHVQEKWYDSIETEEDTYILTIKLNHSGGHSSTASMFVSGAVEATAGTIVSGGISSVTSRCKMQDRLEETLYYLNQKMLEIKSIIQWARRRRIIDPALLEWFKAIIEAQHCLRSIMFVPSTTRIPCQQ